jgi:3-deoxy-D-manno-octulosonate 8-phosphate phosphatase (KDO 8-P phosphatase)
MLILDVDGVLTDGRVIFGSDGKDYRCFDAHDGYGITKAVAKGIRIAVISGKRSAATGARLKRLGIREVYQGEMDKVRVYRKLQKKYRLHNREVCYIGDDDFDLPLLRIVGFSAAPSDAMETVASEVDYVTRKNGGRGAVREVIELILSAKKRA